MIGFIRRILSLLFKFGFYSKHYKITYEGKAVSWNTLYSQGHWKKRSDLKIKYQKIFTILLLEAKVKPMDDFMIVIFYNNRMDVDNVSVNSKWLADVIKGAYVEDDSNDLYRGLMIFHDPSLPKNTIEFHIIGNGNS